MKAILTGLSQRKGKAKATGNEYVISEAHTLFPQNPETRQGASTVYGIGYENKSFSLADGIFEAFDSSTKLPAPFEIEIGFQERNGQQQPVINALNPLKA